MNKLSYEGLEMDVVMFDAQDVIATSIGPAPSQNTPAFTPDNYEMPIGF